MTSALILGLALAQSGAAPSKAPDLIPASKLKADFNAAKNRVRLMFIWAPS